MRVAQLVETRTVEPETVRPMKLEYYKLREEDGEQKTGALYGIGIIKYEENCQDEEAWIDGITPSAEKVMAFIRLLAKGAITPKTVTEIADDLAELCEGSPE